MSDKKKICLRVSTKAYKEFQHMLIDIYGKAYGLIGKTLEEAMNEWVRKKREEDLNE